MAKIWKQKCKVCGEEFGYSSFVLGQEFLRGYSRPERCAACREAHGKDVNKIAFPFFCLKPRQEPFPILGLPYLGRVSEKTRMPPNIKSIDSHPEEMKIRIPEESIRELYEALRKYQVIIIEGPTGCGKSTYIPYRLIEPLEGYSRDHFTKNGPIIITQPRIPPTKGIPIKMSESLLGSPVGTGYEVGYRFRGAEIRDIYDRKIKAYDRYNRIVYVTDGTLLNWIQAGKLGQYSLVIVDEAHERSQNIDLILSFLKRELLKYPHLKLIISSATIDTQSFIEAFKDITKPYLLKLPEIEEVGEKKLGYKVIFNDQTPIPKKRIPEALGDKILEILDKTNGGGILGFLHGELEIKRVIKRIQSNFRFIEKRTTSWGAVLGCIQGKEKSSLAWIFPCYRNLGEERINKEILKVKLDPVLMRRQSIIPRRVIIATNIAETSLTVADATYAVDSGMIKQTEWDRVSRTTRLVPKKHSQDGCKQRWGRVGRVKRGIVYTLYTKEEFESFDKHTPPEIVRSCLESPILNLKTFGINDPKKFPWIEQLSEGFKSELERATKLVEQRKVIDRDGDITESGLELWDTQRLVESDTLDDASLLILADRLGCFPEALLALMFRSLMGANLYHGNGLFKWDLNWDARTKAAVAKIHDGLKIGCKDDLAFLIKLFVCYQKTEKEGRGISWCDRHFINEEVITRALNKMEDIFEAFSRGMKVRKEINPLFLEKVRAVMAIAWPDRIVEIDQDNPRIFKTKIGFSESDSGMISQFSAGDWENEKKAICGATTKELAVIEGKKKVVPSSCFLVKMPRQAEDIEATSLISLLSQLQEIHKENRKEISFLDQSFPIGSKVKVEEKDGKAYITEILESPQPIEISYREPELGEEEIETYAEDLMFSDEETKVKYKQRRKTGEREVKVRLPEDYFSIPETAQGIWAGSEKRKSAKIIEWIEREDKPIAILTPFDEADIAKSLNKKKTVEVIIHHIGRDRVPREEQNPYTKRGWMTARMPIGLDIPVEFNEMTISPLGYGLEEFKGNKITLAIKNIDKRTNLVQVSNIDQVIEDLGNLHKKAQKEKEKILLEGYVMDINEEKENVVVVTPRELGVIHSFEIYKDFIPNQDVNNLQIGERILVGLTPRTDDKVSAELLSETEVKNIPEDWRKEWNSERQEEEIYFPCCLENKDLNAWQASPKVIDFIKRHSWQFCFGAKIVSLKERLSHLSSGDSVRGIIQKINYDTNETTIESVEVILEDGTPGFAFGNDVDRTEIQEGVQLIFKVEKVDSESGFLRLVSQKVIQERQKREKEYSKRMKGHTERWSKLIVKNEDVILRIEKDIEKCQEMKRNARSSEFADTVQKWIEEKYQKIEDIRETNRKLKEKINSVKSEIQN